MRVVPGKRRAHFVLLVLAGAGLGRRRRAPPRRAATTSQNAAPGARADRRSSAHTPGAATITASGRSPHRACGTATTTASLTAGCSTSADSSATVLIHSPPDFTRSLARSWIVRQPLGPIVTMSPVRNHPSSVQRSGASSPGIVGGSHPRSSHLQLAHRVVVPRDHARPRRAANLDERRGPSLPRAPRVVRVGRGVRELTGRG